LRVIRKKLRATDNIFNLKVINMSEWTATILYMGILLLAIFLESIGDALYDDGLKIPAHVMTILFVLVMLGLVVIVGKELVRPITIYTWWLFGGYVLLRHGVYKMTYYISRNMSPPTEFWFFGTRSIALVMGLYCITKGVV